jgi:type VII secretion integral membrane protein EccD
MSVGYTRVTLVGRSRRVDMVLPSSEPVGRLLPDLLGVAGEPAAHPARMRRLVTVGGDVFGDGDSLESVGVADGAVLRLVGAEDLPPAPIVHDVTEETAEDLDGRSTRWGPAVRRWVATAGLAAVVAVATVFVLLHTGPATAAAGSALAGLVLGLAGVACGRLRRPLGLALIAGAAVALPVAAWAWADAEAWAPVWRILAVSAALALAVVLAGLNAERGRAAVAGGTSLLVLCAAWSAAAALGLSGPRLGAVLAVVVVVVVGVLPRLALTWSGLAMLDDRRVEDRPVVRREVRAALAAAHGSLIITVAGAAGSAVLAGVLLAAEPTAWTVSLAALLVVVLLVRSRMYPLAAEVIALLAAAGAVLTVWWWRWAAAGELILPLVVAAAAVTVPVVVLVLDPPEHTRARIRRIGDLLESAAVVALLPVVLGVFGVYPRLIEVF